MTHSTAFEASIKRGTADACPSHLIPAEIEQARALWDSKGEEAKDDILTLLSQQLKANFVLCNIPTLVDIMALEEDEDVEAARVEAYDFSFPDEGLPSVSAYACYTLPLRKPMTQEDLEDWEEEQGEYLTDCVNFFWAFEDPEENWLSVLGEHEGAGMGISG